MPTLAQIALDFCRECLGWHHPMLGTFDSSQAVSGASALGFTDLGAVIESVRHWCDEHDHWIELHSYWKEGWMAEVGSSGEDDGEHAISADPCHALMAACVEAARKLKGAA